jgi:hypothetical protein
MQGRLALGVVGAREVAAALDQRRRDLAPIPTTGRSPRGAASTAAGRTPRRRARTRGAERRPDRRGSRDDADPAPAACRPPAAAASSRSSSAPSRRTRCPSARRTPRREHVGGGRPSQSATPARPARAASASAAPPERRDRRRDEQQRHTTSAGTGRASPSTPAAACTSPNASGCSMPHLRVDLRVRRRVAPQPRPDRDHRRLLHRCRHRREAPVAEDVDLVEAEPARRRLSRALSQSLNRSSV